MTQPSRSLSVTFTIGQSSHCPPRFKERKIKEFAVLFFGFVLFVVTVFGWGMGVLVPQPGMEPVPLPVVEALATGLTGNSLQPALS